MKHNSFYKKIGQGKTLVLLHGFLESSEVWNELVKALKNDFSFIIPDLLGHGKTPSIAKIHSMEMMAEAVFSVLEDEKINEAIFIGHSMGGYVSLAFAEKYPQKVAGLVLMNSTPLPDSDEKKINRERAANAVDNDKNFFIRNAVTHLFSEKNQKLLIGEVEEIIEIAMKTPSEGIKAASLGMKDRPDRTHILRSAPTKLLIIGKDDGLIPAKELTDLATKNNIPFALLEGGHMSYIENKSETIEILKKFADEI